MRTHKGNVRYYYDSDNHLIALAKGNSTLFFYYDNNGNPTSFSDGTNMYYYVKNIQGDIVKIISSTGAVVANYAYNVWGELLSVKDSFGNPITNQTSIAYLNPFRYRGYVYDDETDLYYLQSRYYDPVTCRFINADIYCDTQTNTPFSTNMFAYCENNIINKIDYDGRNAYWLHNINDVRVLNSTMGHVSLLIEQSYDNWWYFYWGSEDIQLLHLGKGRSLTKFNQFLHGNNPWKYNYYKNLYYTHSTRIIGDFRQSINYIFYNIFGNKKNKSITSQCYSYNNRKYKNKKYKLMDYNCVVVSIEVLKIGKFYYAKTGRYDNDIDLLKRAMLDKAMKDGYNIPNKVYPKLNYFFYI